MIITELLDANLRKAYGGSYGDAVNISKDVAHASSELPP